MRGENVGIGAGKHKNGLGKFQDEGKYNKMRWKNNRMRQENTKMRQKNIWIRGKYWAGVEKS